MKMMNFLGNIFFLSNSSVFYITTSSGCPVVKSLMRDLKQRRRRRKRKRHLKSKFALPQFLSRLFHLVQFVKYWQIWLYEKFRKKKRKENCCFLFQSSTKREIRQRRLRNVQNNAMHVQKLKMLFCLNKPICRSPVSVAVFVALAPYCLLFSTFSIIRKCTFIKFHQLTHSHLLQFFLQVLRSSTINGFLPLIKHLLSFIMFKFIRRTKIF